MPKDNWGQYYKCVHSCVNGQGNHYCKRDYGNGHTSYHYSNSDGSYYYAHMKGSTYTSTYHNDGKGGATYISSKGKSWTTKQ